MQTTTDSNLYRIVFKDNGPGIDPETAVRAFDPLFSTKSYGCGLGLATVKKIIEQHGGTVSLDSNVGVGTQVTVSLPAKRARERAA